MTSNSESQSHSTPAKNKDKKQQQQQLQKKLSLGDIFDDETTGPNGSGGLQDDGDYEKTLREFMMDDDSEDWLGNKDQVKPFQINDGQPNGNQSDDDDDEGFTYSGQSTKSGENGDDQDDDDGKDEFFYGGVDRRKEILEDDEKDLNLNSGDYSTDLKDVMGSDEEQEEEDSQSEPSQDQSQSQGSNGINQSLNNSNPDDSNATDSVLPNHINGKESSRDQESSSRPSLSTFNSTTSSLHSTWNLPRRPVEYPTISRLRSSAFNPNPSSSNQRQTSWGSGSIRSTSGFSLSAIAGPSSSNGISTSTPPNEMFTPSIRSRSSSVSTSATVSKRKRSFPYGHGQLPASLSSVDREGIAASSIDADQSSISATGSLKQSAGVNGNFIGSSSISTSDPPIEREICRYSSLRKVSNIIYPTGRKPISLDRIPEDRLEPNGNGIGKGKGKDQDSTSKYGNPTVMSVAGGLMAIGTESGWTMVFDYQSQELKCVCGNEALGESVVKRADRL